MSASSYIFTVADFNIKVHVNAEIPLIFEDGYEHFVQPGQGENQPLDMEVEAFAGIPDQYLVQNPIESLFEAKKDKHLLWQIYKQDKGFRFVIQNQRNLNSIQQVAIVSADFKSWKVFCQPITQDGYTFICPLLYPLGPLIMYYLTTFSPAIMVHASGVDKAGVGRIFSGFSGVGKSTMAKNWEKTGATIINDDRLIIREINGDYVIYNTPMFYSDFPKSVKLKGIFLPYHCPVNQIAKLNRSNAVKAFFPFCIQHSYLKEGMLNHLDFVSSLTRDVPVYTLGVVPTTAIVTYIEENE